MDNQLALSRVFVAMLFSRQACEIVYHHSLIICSIQYAPERELFFELQKKLKNILSYSRFAFCFDISLGLLCRQLPGMNLKQRSSQYLPVQYL